MHPRSATLSLDNVLNIAKEAITPIRCDWGDCSCVLNSWQSLREHQHRHCFFTEGQYQCRIKRCSARFHTSRKDIYNHIDASHMIRVPVPCPAIECPEMFGRHNYLASHFEASHRRLVDITLTLPSKLIKQSCRIFTPRLPELPPLPDGPLPVYMYLQLPISPSPNRWMQPITRQHSKDDRAELQFSDLVRIDPEVDFQDPTVNFPDLIVRPRIGEPPPLQLAAPQSMTAVPPPDIIPPRSIGYDVFALKVDDLLSKGLLDGTNKNLASPKKARPNR